MRWRRTGVVVLIAMSAAVACDSGPAPPNPSPTRSSPTVSVDPPAPVRVAFFIDASIPDALELVASAQLAMQLAFTRAIEAGALPPGSEVVSLDTRGDAATAVALAREAAADPQLVAAVEGPFWAPIDQVRAVLADAGVPIVSLSSLGRPAREGSWLRLVPTLRDEARTIAAASPERPRACLLGDVSAYSEAATRAIAGAFRRSSSVARPRRIDDGDVRRCGRVIWTGGPLEGAELVTRLHDAHPRVPVVMTPFARTQSFLEGVDAARAVTAVCGCVDLSTSTSEEALQLLHDFQRTHGIPLGPYGVEGWDLGQALVEAIGPLGADRLEVAAALSVPHRIEGLGGTYTVGSDRERSDPTVYAYHATATRWLPADDR